MDHKQKNGDPAKIAAPQSTTQPPTPSFIVSLAKSVDDKQARVNATPELATVVEYIRTGRYNNAAVEVPDFPPLQPTTNKIQALFADVLKRSGGNRDAAKGAIDHLKNGLPVMLPCGEFTKQGNKFLIQASGLAPVDYDALGNRVRDVREKLQASPYCVLCQKSPSGDGVKALFRAPPTCDNTEHFQRYFTACEHVTKLTGIDPRVEDDSGKDIARRYFLCYDPDIYFNPDAQELELLPLPEAAPKAETPKADKRNKPDKELVRKLLSHIPTGPEYPRWMEIISAVSDALSIEESIEVLHEWSAEEKPGEYKEKLKHRLEKVTVGTLFFLAKQGGWKRANAEGHNKRSYKLVDLATIKARAVAWVEENYLARGEFHILQGQGGSYKGTLALTWAAEFSKREEHVLLVLAEDDLATKVKPALMAAGADMAFIHPLIIHSGESVDALVLPDDIPQLEKAIEETGARFVVIDPLLTHVSGKFDSHRDHDMKRVLTQIGKLAQRADATIVGVHHTKKDTSGGMKLAGMGSIAFYTTARVVMAMAKISEQESVLEVVKSNIGAEGVRQALRAELVMVAGSIKIPRLTRAGESSVSVAEALSGEKKENTSKALAAARLMLNILEEEGEQKQTLLFDRVAEETGLKVSSIRRHVYFGLLNKEDLVTSRKDGLQGGWIVERSDKERPAKFGGGVGSAGQRGKISFEACQGCGDIIDLHGACACQRAA